jgi:hypothetical protein
MRPERTLTNILFGGNVSSELQPNMTVIAIHVDCICPVHGKLLHSGSFRGCHGVVCSGRRDESSRREKPLRAWAIKPTCACGLGSQKNPEKPICCHNMWRRPSARVAKVGPPNLGPQEASVQRAAADTPMRLDRPQADLRRTVLRADAPRIIRAALHRR